METEHHDSSESWAEKMYLISKDDWEILSKEKHKIEQQEQLDAHEPSVSQEQIQEQSSQQPQPQSKPQPQSQFRPQPDETGEGKRYADLDIKKFNQNFLTRQNIERVLENQKWNKVFDRIKPFLDQNNSKKETATLITPKTDNLNFDGDLMSHSIPSTSPISKQDEILRSNIHTRLLPSMTKSAHVSQPLKRQKEAQEEVEEAERSGTRPKYIINQKGRRGKKARQRIIDNLSPNTSPSLPYQSTRNKRKQRKGESDNEDDVKPSGRGFKKFRGWAKF